MALAQDILALLVTDTKSVHAPFQEVHDFLAVAGRVLQRALSPTLRPLLFLLLHGTASSTKDIKVRDKQRHAARYLAAQAEELLLAQQKDIFAHRHGHGIFEGLDGPLEGAPLRQDTVITNKRNPFDRQLHKRRRQVGVQPHTLYVSKHARALVKGNAEAGMNKLITKSLICQSEGPQTQHLLSDRWHRVHDHIRQGVPRLGHQLELVLNQAQMRHAFIHRREWECVH